MSRELSQIWLNTKALDTGNVGITTSYIPNVATTSVSNYNGLYGTSTIKTNNNYYDHRRVAPWGDYWNQYADSNHRPFLENYNGLAAVGIITGDSYLESITKFFYDATNYDSNTYSVSGIIVFYCICTSFK